MRLTLRAYQIAAYYASFAVFALMALALNCLCMLFGSFVKPAVREPLTQRLVHRAFMIFVRWLSLAGIVPVRYEGFERWPKSRGLVVAANHPGLVDVGWLLARLPEAVCVTKPDVRQNPLYGATARCAGYLYSDRGLQLLRSAAEKIARGQTLLVFPEGTRSREGTLNPLKPGFVAVARIARAPIQLVRITCDSALLTKERPWWVVPHLPATVTVALGPCLEPPGRDTDGVVDRIEAWFEQGETPVAARPPRTGSVQLPVHT